MQTSVRVTASLVCLAAASFSTSTAKAEDIKPTSIAVVDSSETVIPFLTELKPTGIQVIGRYVGRCPQFGKRMIDHPGERENDRSEFVRFGNARPQGVDGRWVCRSKCRYDFFKLHYTDISGPCLACESATTFSTSCIGSRRRQPGVDSGNGPNLGHHRCSPRNGIIPAKWDGLRALTSSQACEDEIRTMLAPKLLTQNRGVSRYRFSLP